MTQNENGLSERHKQALSEGRTQGKAVRAYLNALVSQRPRRGRKRTAESIGRRINAIDAQLAGGVDVMTRLALTQERMDLDQERANFAKAADIRKLEEGFVAVAGEYSSRKGIGYTAWRELGVPAAVLKRAGVSRSGRPSGKAGPGAAKAAAAEAPSAAPAAAKPAAKPAARSRRKTAAAGAKATTSAKAVKPRASKAASAS